MVQLMGVVAMVRAKEDRVKTGLLWFDDNPKVSVAAKIEQAARRYRERFGGAPNVCYVHPKTLAGVSLSRGDIQVVELTNIQPNHFWIGTRSS